MQGEIERGPSEATASSTAAGRAQHHGAPQEKPHCSGDTMAHIRLQNSPDNPRLAAALAYAARGWPVFPCHGMQDGQCTCSGKPNCTPGKHPLTAHGFEDATTDPKQIDRWWTENPDANVAVATGACSGLIVVDEDPRHGGDLTLEDLEAQYGKLPDTVISLTGGGGKHYVFRHFGKA